MRIPAGFIVAALLAVLAFYLEEVFKRHHELVTCAQQGGCAAASLNWELSAYEWQMFVVNIVKEGAIVFISVWGVSIVYEWLIAEKHFNKFKGHLESIISRGNSNASACEALGIVGIYKDRASYEAAHPFSTILPQMQDKDRLLVVGRSLIFLMYNWDALKPVIEKGGSVQLCCLDPTYSDGYLKELAGYSNSETLFAIERLQESVAPWLTKETKSGQFEIRFHKLPLLDSYSEVKRGEETHVSWDLNFGQGLQRRHVLYVDREGALGESLGPNRYHKIWELAQVVYKYENGQESKNDLKRFLDAPRGAQPVETNPNRAGE